MKFKRSLTVKEETEIRRRFFKLRHSAERLQRDFHISHHLLSSITGGSRTGLTIEKAYG